MKKVLLTISILLFAGLTADVLAQRNRPEDRRPRREETLNNRRGDRNGFRANNRNRNRKERIVDQRVYRNRGWQNYGYSDTFGNRRGRFYDYDFRRGRRIVVNRGYRPSRRHIWVAGHWRFSRRLGRDVWMDGRWALRRAHHRWIPGRYQRFNGVRVWIDGCWSVVY